MAMIDNAIVAIRGGGIPKESALHQAWCTKPQTIEGRDFVEIDATVRGVCKFLNNDFRMVRALQGKRNAQVTELMSSVTQASVDPNGLGVDMANDAKRQKRDLIDDLPPLIDIEYKTSNGITHVVTVLSTWMDRANLVIELKQSNLDLLTEDPELPSAAEEEEEQERAWEPTLTEGPVKSFHKRSAVGVRLKHEGKWSLKTVRITSNDDTSVMQSDVERAVPVLTRLVGE